MSFESQCTHATFVVFRPRQSHTVNIIFTYIFAPTIIEKQPQSAHAPIFIFPNVSFPSVRTMPKLQGQSSNDPTPKITHPYNLRSLKHKRTAFPHENDDLVYVGTTRRRDDVAAARRQIRRRRERPVMMTMRTTTAKTKKTTPTPHNRLRSRPPQSLRPRRLRRRHLGQKQHLSRPRPATHIDRSYASRSGRHTSNIHTAAVATVVVDNITARDVDPPMAVDDISDAGTANPTAAHLVGHNPTTPFGSDDDNDIDEDVHCIFHNPDMNASTCSSSPRCQPPPPVVQSAVDHSHVASASSNPSVCEHGNTYYDDHSHDRRTLTRCELLPYRFFSRPSTSANRGRSAD